MIYLDSTNPNLQVPRSVATCPICDSSLIVESIDEWDAETGVPLDISFNCMTEPDIDSDEWETWHYAHWSQPYVDWLPLEPKVEKWVQKNYRVKE